MCRSVLERRELLAVATRKREKTAGEVQEHTNTWSAGAGGSGESAGTWPTGGNGRTSCSEALPPADDAKEVVEKARKDSSIWAVTRPAEVHRGFDLPRDGHCWDMARRRWEIRDARCEKRREDSRGIKIKIKTGDDDDDDEKRSR